MKTTKARRRPRNGATAHRGTSILRVSEDIVPIGQFKTHASGMLRRVRISGQPIVVTHHGRAAAVVLSPDEYDRLTERERFVRAVEEGLADSEAGRLTDHDEVKRMLETRFGPLGRR